MNDINELETYLGNGVECEFRRNDGEKITILMKPFKGGYLPKVLAIREKVMAATNPDGTVDEKNLRGESIQDFVDLIYEWCDMNFEGDVGEDEKTNILKTFVDMNLQELAQYFFKIHGLDKKTERDELREEVANQIARTPKRDRNQPGGIARVEQEG